MTEKNNFNHVPRMCRCNNSDMCEDAQLGCLDSVHEAISRVLSIQ